MNEDKAIWWWVAAVVVAAFAAAGWWWWQGRTAPPLPKAEAPALPAVPSVEAPQADARIEHPIEGAPAARDAARDVAPLPLLAESDSALRAAIGGLVGEQLLVELFHMTGIANRLVATVDNLPRGKVAVKIQPLRAPGGAFAVDGSGDERTIGAANAGRYAAHLRLLDAVDTRKAAALYVRFYPLLQQAYRDLGYPQGNFNDRLVAVIDHLLATPAVDGPIRLVQPKVLYEFADPELEARSAGQKLLLRMGTASAARVKQKLREFRREITAAPAPQ